MNTVPRPLKTARFFTESVVTNVSGPTTLFLDGIASTSNFDAGSSLISTMILRIKQTKKHTSGVEAALVMGFTLTDIIKMTVQTSGDGGGGHLYIKMDIEGAEFAVLNEAVVASLCQLLVQEHKFKVAILVEIHAAAANQNDKDLYESQSVEALRVCGVLVMHGDGG
jgi:hypothetical protein